LFVFIKAYSQDAVLINYKTTIDFSDFNLNREISYEILICNQKGEEYTSVSIPYNKQIKISDLTATITDLTGKTISKLKSSEIKKRTLNSDVAFFWDMMQIEFSLHHYSYPYIFKYSYKVQSREFLYIDNWHPFLSPSVETINAELIINKPKAYDIYYKCKNIETPIIDTTLIPTVYKWKTKFKPLPDPEVQMSDADNILPVVSIVPKKFKYQKPGTYESWKTYGQWQFDISKKLQELSESENAEIHRIVDNIPDTTEKIRTMYHRLQDQTRYVNISLKKGGMIPVSAAEVSAKKFGDCKGLTNYFCTMLKSAGIKSICVDVNAGNSISPIDIDFPSQQFNHVILCVPLQNDTVWLDCTSSGPFGYLGTFTQNRPVLLMEDNQSHITSTPALTTSDVLNERKYIIREDSTGSVDITASCIYRGDDFEKLLGIMKLPDYKIQKYAGEYYGLKNTNVLIYNISHLNRDDRHIHLDFEGVSNKIERVGKEILIHTIPFDIPLFKKPSQRNYPVSFDFPVCVSDSQIVVFKNKLPDYEKIDDVNINSPYGSYSKSIKVTGNNLIVTKKLTINSGSYSLKEYPEFYAFIEKLKENENQIIILNQNQ